MTTVHGHTNALTIQSVSSEPVRLSKIDSLPKNLIHREHIDLLYAEYHPHRLIAHDFLLVVRVLKLIPLYVFPQLFDYLWPGEVSYLEEV